MLYLRSFNRFILIGLALLGLSISSANAATLDFEDLSCTGIPTFCFVSAAAGGLYNGFQWGGQSYLLESDEYPSTPNGYQTGSVSGDNVYFTWSGGGFVSRSVLFDFNGATFTAAWRDGLTLDISGWNSGTELYSDTFAINTQVPLELFVNYLGIDTLKINPRNDGTGHVGYPFNNNHVVMDNFKYDMPRVGAVPVPAAIWLFGTALIGLVGFGKRKKAA